MRSIVAEDSGCDVEPGTVFRCHYIDPSGGCWTSDVTREGDLPLDEAGWCIASPEDLERGDVMPASYIRVG